MFASVVTQGRRMFAVDKCNNPTISKTTLTAVHVNGCEKQQCTIVSGHGISSPISLFVR